jgi:hypothetical protein
VTSEVNLRFKVAGHSAAEWTASNPVLNEREWGDELDTGKVKRGDGATPWNGLPYRTYWSAWGQIGGSLSSQTDLQAALNAKEPTITAGTTAQYYRGDKTWQTLNAAAVGLGNLSNTVTGTGPVVLATNPALATQIVLNSTGSADFYFTANSSAFAGRMRLATDGSLVFRSETAGGVFFDAYNGVATFRNFATGGATILRVSAADVRPGADNSTNLGTASFRWKEVFAGNATINTSDERLKDWLGGLTPDMLRAGLRIADEIGLYRWVGGSRIHVGVRAQQVARILMDEGVEDLQPLDIAADVFVPEDERPSFRMAFLTFDSWEAEREPVMREKCVKRATATTTAVTDTVQRVATPSYRLKKGEVIGADGLVWRERPAGNVFGVRTGELNLFLFACQAAEQRRVAEQLETLTAQLQVLGVT